MTLETLMKAFAVVGFGVLLGIGFIIAHLLMDLLTRVFDEIVRFFLRLIHVIKYSRKPEKKKKAHFGRKKGGIVE